MGFEKEIIYETLKLSKNNFDEALERILGNFTEVPTS